MRIRDWSSNVCSSDLLDPRDQRGHRLRIVIEFVRVAAAELVPLPGVMAEPAPDRVARRRVPRPVLQVPRVLAQAEWPEHVDQPPAAVLRCVGPLHPPHAYSRATPPPRPQIAPPPAPPPQHR